MNNNTTPLKSRRSFLKNSAIASGSFFIVPRHVLGKGFVAPSDKVNIAAVGVGGRGRQNVEELLKLDDVQVTAIADPAESWDLAAFYYKSKAGRGPVKAMVEEHFQEKSPNYKVNVYEDFRVMLEKESSLDAILCATPDHLHAYVSLLSMRAGKHVYCEKPLTHNIWEARMVAKVAKETGLATQLGNQLHSTGYVRTAVEYMRAGVIGKISEAHSWVPATRWDNSLVEMPKEVSPLPEGLNWDLWIGPRSSRPFNNAYAPVTWRDFWEFGCGALGDFGCHDMDAATWGLDLPAPETIEVRPAGFSNESLTPYGEIGYYNFATSAENGPVKLTWYSGGLQPELPEMAPRDFKLPRRGSMYVGEKGVMVTGGGGDPKVFPDDLYAGGSINETLSVTNGHHRDWVDAIKGGPAASSNFEYGAHLTEITLLGVLSLRLGGQKIYWDAENMKAVGIPEADQYIEEPLRSGWEM
ncbi:MAG: Gfo/Idh/MocA family oxidoreductase [Saprospiraceae bacterium]|nr:Gfo/Idh/MocA family oxidoreductase [Saprospiraceae bacterium]